MTLKSMKIRFLMTKLPLWAKASSVRKKPKQDWLTKLVSQSFNSIKPNKSSINSRFTNSLLVTDTITENNLSIGNLVSLISIGSLVSLISIGSLVSLIKSLKFPSMVLWETKLSSSVSDQKTKLKSPKPKLINPGSQKTTVKLDQTWQQPACFVKARRTF